MNDLNFLKHQTEAQRCYGCGVPFCQTGTVIDGKQFGCPLHNLIPEWNHMLGNGNLQQAVSRLLQTNCFPEITGRICPAFCQQVCLHKEVDTPVQTRANELFLAEYAFEKGLIAPLIPTLYSDCTIAIIGAGPMGLAAAHYLSARGHTVTVYDKAAAPGGQLLTNVSEKRLPRDILARRIALLEAQGVEFRTNEEVDEESLKTFYDGVVNCTHGQPRPSVALAIAAGTKAAADAEKALIGYTNLL